MLSVHQATLKAENGFPASPKWMAFLLVMPRCSARLLEGSSSDAKRAESRDGAEISYLAVSCHLRRSPQPPRNTDPSFQLWSFAPTPTTGPITLRGRPPNCPCPCTVGHGPGPSCTQERALPAALHLNQWWQQHLSLLPAPVGTATMLQFQGAHTRVWGVNSQMVRGQLKIWSPKTEMPEQNKHIWSWLGKGSLMVIWHLVKVQDKRNLILLDVLESRTKIGLDPLELKQELTKTLFPVSPFVAKLNYLPYPKARL